MRHSFKKSVTLSLAALTLVIGVGGAAAPAAAHHLPGGGFGGGHFGGGHFGGGRFWGGRHWGRGFGYGLIGVGVAADASSCVGYRNIYDQYGNYLGQQTFNICQ